MSFQQAAAFFLLLCTAGQLVHASFPLPPGSKSPSNKDKTPYSPPASPPAYSPPTYSPSPRPSPPPYSPPSPPSSPPSWKPAVYGIWPGRLPKTFPVWKPAVYSAPYNGGKQRSLREDAQPVHLFKHEAEASLATDTQARFPAAGTVLELQQTLDLHSVLYTLVWEQRAQQVETTPDGKPAGPTFSLGSFEARDELQWSYTNGDSNWCPQARKTQVHYSVHPAQTTYRLDKVEEPEPCSFTFYVSGP